MSRGPDVTTLLERVLFESADAAGCPLRFIGSDLTRWASATFAGAKHELDLEAETSPALDAWLAALPETEFTMRGHLIADIVVESRRREGELTKIALEVLTVDA
jgi:hypothetical protein